MRSVVLLLGLSASGCGLISSDVTDFDLTLPDKTFTIDSGAWDVDATKGPQLLSMNCASMPTVCDAAAQQACSNGCSGTCDADTQTCDMSLPFSLFNKVDLVMEKPELKTINSEPVIKVTIDSVTYEVSSNTLNVDTPDMTIFVAPATVMDPTDPMATPIGTLAGVKAGETTDAPQNLEFTDAGKQDLIDIMSTFRTPFNIIVASTLTLKDGDQVPQGKLDAVVHITAHAGL